MSLDANGFKTKGQYQGYDPSLYSSYAEALKAGQSSLEKAPGRATTQGGARFSIAGSEAAQIQAQLGQLQQQRTVDPWSFYRGGAADKLAGMVGQGSPSDFYANRLKGLMTGDFTTSDPSYDWRFQQGQKAVERSAASRGLLGSGNAGIELQQYGQGMASQEYQAQFNRIVQAMLGTEQTYDAKFDRLAELAGVRNVGAGIAQKQLDSGIAENANMESGIAAALNPPKDPYEGYKFG